MKKRTLVLGGLLMAVAITGYSVSGTYAKYISGIDETDEARVAKWSFGEGLNEAGVADLFKSSYTLKKDGCTGTKCDYTYVVSSDTSDVIAPGTNGEYTFEINGEMETNYILNIAIDGDNTYNTVTLTNGEILSASDLGSLNASDIAYNPLRFRLYKHNIDSTTGTDNTTDTDKGYWLTYDEFIAAFKKMFNPGTTTTSSKKVNNPLYVQAANNNIDLGTYTIEWAWSFDYADLAANYNASTSTKTQDAVIANAHAAQIGIGSLTTSKKVEAYTATINKYDTLLGNSIIDGVKTYNGMSDATTTAAKKKEEYKKSGAYKNVSLNVNISATQTTCEAGTLVSDCTK